MPSASIGSPRATLHDASLINGPLLREYLAQQGTTSEAIIVELLTSIDVLGVLRDGGLTDAQIERLQDRLLDARGTPPR